jgi:aspartate dehydrogenase
MTHGGSRRKPLRLAFVGWGAIARRAADLLQERNDNIAVVGIATRHAPQPDGGLFEGARWLTTPGSLRDVEPDLVVEAAGRAAVEPWGLESLRCAAGFVVSSTSAFSDDAVVQRLVDEAERCGSQILIPSGGLAGLDALAAASRLPLESVTHRIIKPPRAWKGTQAEDLVELDALTSAHVFYRGPAREAASRFPANANVAAISALAGIGFDRTMVELVADPNIRENCHHLTARGEFGVLNVMVENRPLAVNPKSSELAALNLVRLIENRYWLICVALVS